MNLLTAGDQAILVRFGDTISAAVHARLMVALGALERARPSWVVDLVPAYASLLVRYDALQVTDAEARAFVGQVVRKVGARAAAPPPGRLVEIPVWYHPTVAPDLEELAAARGLTPAALGARHAAPEYRVYALGFRPGFAFMGTVDAALAAPRLPQPRPRVAAGSVGIAGRQTGVYPAQGPGGWRIVGRTPLLLFDLARPDPFALHAGDRVCFVPIDGPRYQELAGAGRSQL